MHIYIYARCALVVVRYTAPFTLCSPYKQTLSEAHTQTSLNVVMLSVFTCALLLVRAPEEACMRP